MDGLENHSPICIVVLILEFVFYPLKSPAVVRTPASNACNEDE